MLTARQQEIWRISSSTYVDGHGYPADRARDRRGGRPRLAVDRARAPREPRAGRPAAARSDEAARARAHRPPARARPESGVASRVREAAAPRADRGRRPAARRAERRGRGRRAGAARPRRRLPAPRARRLDDRRRASSTATSSSCRPAGRPQRRHRRRARGRRRVGRRGDGEDLLPRGATAVRLQPENDALEPIYAQHVADPRQVTGVFRTRRDGACVPHTARSSRS